MYVSQAEPYMYVCTYTHTQVDGAKQSAIAPQTTTASVAFRSYFIKSIVK